MDKLNFERVDSQEHKIKSVASAWFAAFNKHDINALLCLYEENARHFSPRLVVSKPETGGYISGKAALHEWWTGAFQDIPTLQYAVIEIKVEGDNAKMKYKRTAAGQKDSIISETLTIKDGKIVSSSVDAIEEVPEKKVYDPMPYGTQAELENIEKNRQARRCESMVGEKYLYTQTGTEIYISNANPRELTITMKNKETGDEQIIDYHKFMLLIKSGSVKKG